MLLLHLATFSAFDDKFLICPNWYSILLVICIELYYIILGSPLIKYASIVQIVVFQTTWLIIFIKNINSSANTSHIYLLWIFMQLHKFSQLSWQVNWVLSPREYSLTYDWKCVIISIGIKTKQTLSSVSKMCKVCLCTEGKSNFRRKVKMKECYLIRIS